MEKSTTAKSRAVTAPTAERRRHRPRSETRALLLGAATRVAISRGRSETDDEHNLLADVRITDVLAEVNRQAEDGGRPMTTGAFYQIWADQESFQRELLAHIMDQIATPGREEIDKLAFEMVADRAPGDEIFRELSDADFRTARQSPEIFLALGLGALASPDMVRDAQEVANRKFLEAFEHLFTTLMRYSGRRLRAGRTLADLIWATEALQVGYLLRSRSHPNIPEQLDDEGWTARASAYLGIINAFTEQVPATRTAG